MNENTVALAAITLTGTIANAKDNGLYFNHKD